jgi:hypothetical protein
MDMNGGGSKGDGQDWGRINVQDYYELFYWATEFEVTADQIQQAVARVGNSVAEVHHYLRQSGTLLHDDPETVPAFWNPRPG